MATGINFNGLGSGIDFSKITDAIIADRNRPIALLQNKSDTYTRRGELLKQFNGLLVTLTTAAKDLTNRELGNSRSAVSVDNTVISATATADAALGSLDISVARLATSFNQSTRAYVATSAPVLTGGATTATFELRKGGATSGGTSITIDATNNSLAGLRDAINAADAGLRASIVDVTGGGSFQLVLSSKETGTAGRVELIETTATGTGTDLALRANNPPGATTDFAQLDAQLSVNGLTLTRPANSISDVVPGVTFNLKKPGATTINVNASTEITGKLQSFVAAFNAVQEFIGGQYTKDGQGRPTGALAGDSTLRAVQQQLRDAVGTPSGSNGGTLTSLAEIGINRGADGKLTLDTAKLNEQLTNSAADVKALLSGLTEGQTGLAQRIYAQTSQLSDSVSGVIQTAIKGYQNSVQNLNQTISKQLERLSTLRDSLTRQFAAADAAIGQLNGQNTALTNVLKSLEPRQQS